jgi:tetratricopeptide (TPR) repeat protein
VALAERLERNQLYARAAEAWREASRIAPPVGDARARRLFRIGKNLHLAGQYDEALAFLFAAEAIDSTRQWKRSIDPMVLEALSALGREDVRAYQALERAGVTPETTTSQPGGEALARIGNEVVTQLDLDTFARRMVRRQLAPQRHFMTADAFADGVERAMEQFKSPEQRRPLLESYVTQELMYREALAYGVGDRDAVKASLVDARRQILIDAYVDHYLSQSVQIDDAGIADAYNAHRDQYTELEAVRVDAIVVDREEAKHLVDAALASGEAFDAVRKAHGVDADNNAVTSWITRDGTLPGVDDARAVLAHLFTLEPGQVSERWFAGPNRWSRYRLVERRDQRQLTLDESRDRVIGQLRQRKQQEAMQRLQETLRGKYAVEFPSGESESQP